MSVSSSIEWTDSTWNPTRGCSHVSAGCVNCYAERFAARTGFAGGAHAGFVRQTRSGPKWTGRVELVPERLELPLGWKKPRRVFVDSMSDLFHESLSDEAIDRVFAVMSLARQHTFLVLTKRAKRMCSYFGDAEERLSSILQAGDAMPRPPMHERTGHYLLPVPNVWLGVSVEDQATADERIPLLLSTPAAKHFVSYEPALGAVDFTRIALPAFANPQPCDPTHASALFDHAGNTEQLDWVIVGGESGPGAREFKLGWAVSTIQQCRAAGVACFVKQLGAKPTGFADLGWRLRPSNSKGADPAEWPLQLRVREFPRDGAAA